MDPTKEFQAIESKGNYVDPKYTEFINNTIKNLMTRKTNQEKGLKNQMKEMKIQKFQKWMKKALEAAKGNHLQKNRRETV